MEIVSRLLGHRTPPEGKKGSEYLEAEVTSWEEAYIGQFHHKQNEYGALLSRRSGSPAIAYASLVANPRETYLNIPLIDQVPQDTLSLKAYYTSFFGNMDPDKFRTFATGALNHNRLLTMLNRNVAGIYNDDICEWFYDSFGVKHQQSDSSVSVITRGIQDTFNITFEPKKSDDFPSGRSAFSAIELTRLIQRSLPDLIIKPFPLDAYLQEVQTTLNFLPKDWHKNRRDTI